MITSTINFSEYSQLEQVQFALSLLEDNGVLSNDESADLLITYVDHHQLVLTD
jgi:hypothetical protein